MVSVLWHYVVYRLGFIVLNHVYRMGSRDGVVVRALASHQCGTGSISRTRRHVWVEFVVGSRPCSEGFFSGSPVFLPSQKPTLQIIIRSHARKTFIIMSSKLLRVTWVNKLHLHFLHRTKPIWILVVWYVQSQKTFLVKTWIHEAVDKKENKQINLWEPCFQKRTTEIASF